MINKKILIMIGIIVFSSSLCACTNQANKENTTTQPKSEITQNKPSNDKSSLEESTKLSSFTDSNIQQEKKSNNAESSGNKVKIYGENKADSNKSVEKQASINTEVNESFKEVSYKKVLLKEVSFNTPWINNVNQNYAICIEGRGDYSVEEGKGTLVIKNLKTGELTGAEFISENKQHTFKKAMWKDNDNIFVIEGFAYGTVSKGGNLYIYNINTQKLRAVPIYLNNEEVVDVKKDEKGFKYVKQVIDSDKTTEEYLNLK